MRKFWLIRHLQRPLQVQEAALVPYQALVTCITAIAHPGAGLPQTLTGSTAEQDGALTFLVVWLMKTH